MAKLNTPKGKLVRKLGVNIFGNPKFDRLLSKKGYGPGQHGNLVKDSLHILFSYKKSKKLSSLMECLKNSLETILKKLLK